MPYKDPELNKVRRRLARCRKAMANGKRYISRMPDARDERERRKLYWRIIQAIYRRLKQFGAASPVERARRVRRNEKRRHAYRVKVEALGRTMRRTRLTVADRREARAIARKNRAKRSHGPGLTRGIRTRLLSLQRGKCAACAVRLRGRGPLKYHLDHIEPLALGGPHCDSNMQLLCPSCNIRKSAKDPVLFMRGMGKLL